MSLRLPDSIASAQDLSELVLDVREYAQWFEHESIKNRIDIKHASEPPILSQAATELLQTLNESKSLSQQSLDTLIETLENFSKNSPSITLTMAAPPNNDLRANLVAWCRKNIDPNILVSFQFNATMLGGIAVRYGSRVFDWSFKRQLLASRQNFPEVLRRV